MHSSNMSGDCRPRSYDIHMGIPHSFMTLKILHRRWKCSAVTSLSYSPPPRLSPTLQAHEWNWNGVPLNCSSLDRWFQRIPLFKGVPRSHPIGAVWRVALQNGSVRDCLDEVLVSLPRTGIPSRFTDGSLILLPKPGKNGKEVGHYRPLVLQCPVGKAILRWAASRVMSTVLPQLLLHPQFAYVPQRNSEMAIFRVQSFLEHRRRIAGYAIPPASWLRDGWCRPECSGCLLVSLDLSQAFDRVDRVLLMQCLSEYAISDDIIGMIWAWHLHPKYRFSIGGHQRNITTSRGVRQGCTIAPLLWILFLHRVVEDLCKIRPETNWLDLLTEYADDLLLCFGIDNAGDVERALERTRFFLEHLQRWGLVVNLNKTQFLLHLSGSVSARVLKKHNCLIQGGSLSSVCHPI